MHRYLGTALLLGAFHCLPAGAALSRQVVNYRIHAELDAQKKTVTGRQTLTWLNDSPGSVAELRFHLYLNAFQNEKSSFMRESGGQLRSDRMAKGGWGWIDLHRFQIENGADLLKSTRYIHPDDTNEDDRTVIAVTLPSPVKPGASITLQIDFVSQLPKVFARTGYRNDFFLVGQWFPKIGVYEKAGMRYAVQGAWNCHQFHANTEFYADYGVYDVEIVAPSDFVIGATGVQQSVAEDAAAKRKTYRFHQEDVHDFAWTASPKFIRVERQFDPAKLVTPAELEATAKLLNLPTAELALKPVRMILLLQPEHRAQIDRHFRATENGLKWFGLWYGAYPYDTITVVDPPYGASGAGGMEYPTFITGGTSWNPGPDDGTPEEVVVHEFGHQYWYGMVGSNEFEESWLDEGFNTYSTSKVMDLAYGTRTLPISFLGLPLGNLLDTPRIGSDAVNRSGHLLYGKHDAVGTNGWQYYNSTSYGINSYMRPGVVLRTLENRLPPGAMARIMRAWYQRYKFQHPTSRDFVRLASEVSGQDLTSYFDQFVFGTNDLNYRVAEVTSERIPPSLGSFLDNGKRIEVTAKDAEKRAGPIRYRTTVRLTREGEAILPVDMEMQLNNGEIIRRHWDGASRWVKLEFTTASRPRSVQIDPGRGILLDSRIADNSWRASPYPLPFARWGSNLLFWLQMVLP
ncbi:MAG: M1 family metallopeptidase [Candidatus Solibacter sp.]